MQLKKFSSSASFHAQRAKNLVFNTIAAISSLCVFGTTGKFHKGHESLRLRAINPKASSLQSDAASVS